METETTNITSNQIDITIRKAVSTLLSGLGTIINSVAIIAVLKGKLYSQKTFKVVLNLFVSNLMMSAVALPLFIVPAFLTFPGNDVTCPFSGFIIYSFCGVCLLSNILISLHHYILIVHITKYEAICSVRNTWIALLFTWFLPPFMFIFPLTEVWGRFIFDQRTLDCTAMNNLDSYRIYILISSFFTCFPPFTFCYIAITRKAISTRHQITIMQTENRQRITEQRQLIRTIFLIITIFTAMNLPYFIFTLWDPQKVKVNLSVHSLALYLGMCNYFFNTLVFLTTNRHMKLSLQKTLRFMFKTMWTILILISKLN